MPITINDCAQCGAEANVDNTEVVFQIWCACNPNLHRLASKVLADEVVLHRDVRKAIERWNELNPIAGQSVTKRIYEDITGEPV